MHFISKLQLMYDHLIVSVTPYNCTKPQFTTVQLDQWTQLAI